jgi:hypothetical protein
VRWLTPTSGLTNEERSSHADQLDRCAAAASGKYNEFQGRRTTHDAGRDLHFIELRQSRIEKVMPWAGTHKGPQALPEGLAAIQRYCQRHWKTLDFKISDTIEQGSRVAFFGSFPYKSNLAGKEITSPFGRLARFEGNKVAYVQFLEDSYGTAGSFKNWGHDTVPQRSLGERG